MITKPILIIPLSGEGSRFSKIGVSREKQLLKFDDGTTPLIRSLESIANISDFEVIFSTKNEIQMDKIKAHILAHEKYKNLDIRFVITGKTESPVHTIQFVLDKLFTEQDATRSVSIFTMDISLPKPIHLVKGLDATYVFKATKGPYSYVDFDEKGEVFCREKIEIGNLANIGIYAIESIKNLKIAISSALDEKRKTEHSLAETMINSSVSKYELIHVDSVYIYGTPQEWSYFNNVIIPLLISKKNKNVLLFADHSGPDFIENVANNLQENGFKIKKIQNKDELPWSEIVYNNREIIKKLYNEDSYTVIASCMSGQGVANALSKILGVHVPVISNSDQLKLAITHSAGRALSFAAKYCDTTSFISELSTNLLLDFEGGRHQERQTRNLVQSIDKNKFGKIADYENGWLMGGFQPAIHWTPEVEVGIKTFDSSTSKPDRHFHVGGYEFTLLLEGSMKCGDKDLKPGEFSLQAPLEPDLNTFSAGTKILCVRVNAATTRKRFYDQ
tara:strand:- start:22445 stop:23953 length:1509 start_codon:yes stop_codon:yes gene_type:complete